jgi:glycosyltransferase involved in cell wall biosynthesis
MRVALFSDALPPRLDGVAVTVARLVSELAARGHRVALVGPGRCERIPEAELQLALPAVPLPALPGLYAAAPLLGPFAGALDRFGPQIIHALTETPVGLAGRRYATGRRLPLVTSSNTDYPAYFGHWGLRAAMPAVESWMRWFHAPAEVTLCPSQTYMDVLRARGIRRLALWGRGVDCERFAPARATASFRRRVSKRATQIILGVGRLMPEKRFDRLIDAYAALPDALRATTALAIVGDGPSRRSLEAMSPAEVAFTGELRGPELAEAYASSDVFALAADEETFGNVVLEAMASGLPVVVSTRGAARELVTAATGLVIDLERPGALVEGLTMLLRDGALRARLGERSRREAQTRSWDAATEQIVGAYASALSNRGRQSTASRDTGAPTVARSR